MCLCVHIHHDCFATRFSDIGVNQWKDTQFFYSLCVHYKYNRFLYGPTIKTNKTDYRPINQCLILLCSLQHTKEKPKTNNKNLKNKLNKFHAREKFAPFLTYMHILPSTHMSWAVFEAASKIEPIKKRYGKIRIFLRFFFFFFHFSVDVELKQVWYQ